MQSTCSAGISLHSQVFSSNSKTPCYIHSCSQNKGTIITSVGKYSGQCLFWSNFGLIFFNLFGIGFCVFLFVSWHQTLQEQSRILKYREGSYVTFNFDLYYSWTAKLTRTALQIKTLRYLESHMYTQTYTSLKSVFFTISHYSIP